MSSLSSPSMLLHGYSTRHCHQGKEAILSWHREVSHQVVTQWWTLWMMLVTVGYRVLEMVVVVDRPHGQWWPGGWQCRPRGW